MRLYTEAEIAQAMGVKRQNINARASNGRKDRRGNVTEQPWVVHSVRREQNGNRTKLYAFDTLPDDVRAALERHALRTALETPPATAAVAVALPAACTEAAGLSLPVKRADGSLALRGQLRRAKAAGALDDRDRRYLEAALVLCRAVDTAIALAGCSEKRAIRELAARLVAGAATPELAAAAAATYLKPRRAAGYLGGEAAQVSRLQKMMAFYRAGAVEGDAGRYLVAGRTLKHGPKHEDVVAFLRFYCRPSRPSVQLAWKEAKGWYAAHNLARPSASTWRRIENSLPVTVKYRGRMTGAAFAALRPYIDRDVSMFHANDIWVGDGHTFKARVRNPDTGKPYRPEVTVVLDWVSRKVVGWSVDLAESTIAVSAALRHAQMQTRARPLVYYSDKGSGQTGKKIDHPVTGTAARQGFDHQTGIPGNPQGRGVIERLWTSLLIPLAKRYPTCITKDADRDHVRKTTQALAKAERAGEESALVPSFGQFLADLAEVIETYNASHEHSGLGGKTPNEVFTERLDPDSIVFGVDDTDIHALWMPEEIRSHDRGVVSLFNNTYFRADLPDILAEKEKVRVRFDIHDARQVWLYRMDGTEIGAAEFEGNKRAAFPVSYIEMKRDERAEGIIGRANREIERAEAERARVIEGEILDVSAFMPPCREAVPVAGEVEPAAAAPAGGRPMFLTDPDKYRWLVQHKAAWTADDRDWLWEYLASDGYAGLLQRYEFEGLAWGAEDEERLKDFEATAGV